MRSSSSAAGSARRRSTPRPGGPSTTQRSWSPATGSTTGSSHPRGYGCYAQVLGTFVRERGLVSLERAVHLMSGLPAERFGITDRGRVVEGLAADLVVFDPATVGAGATWEEPRRPATGIDAVVVNGEIVARDGRPTDARPGRVIRAGNRH